MLDLRNFNSDKEIKNYIEKTIKNIRNIGECRLYREEQLQCTENVFRARNSTEWIIRINKVIEDFKYAIMQAYQYAKIMKSPLEETINSKRYAFYLEDAVYRDIVLWEMLRQFLNEFYECGYDTDDEINIFNFLKDANVKSKIGNQNIKKLKNYLYCNSHHMVRHELRNQFAHSLDNTSSYLFHRVSDNGLLQADMSRFLPKHPYENIVMVLDDIKSFLKFIRYYSGKLNELLIENIMMVNVEMELRCGEKRKDEEHWSISILKEKAEQILLQCDKTCDFAISYNDKMWCKPTKICYCRINEKCDEYKGVIKTKMSYEEMKEHYGYADIKGE